MTDDQPSAAHGSEPRQVASIRIGGYVFLCMRTTLDINDELFWAAKAHAVAGRTTLKATVEQALRTFLAGPARPRSDPPPIPVFRGRGVQPGVDLTDSAALEGMMDAEP